MEDLKGLLENHIMLHRAFGNLFALPYPALFTPWLLGAIIYNSLTYITGPHFDGIILVKYNINICVFMFLSPDTSMISSWPTALEPQFWIFEFQKPRPKGTGSDSCAQTMAVWKTDEWWLGGAMDMSTVSVLSALNLRAPPVVSAQEPHGDKEDTQEWLMNVNCL